MLLIFCMRPPYSYSSILLKRKNESNKVHNSQEPAFKHYLVCIKHSSVLAYCGASMHPEMHSGLFPWHTGIQHEYTRSRRVYLGQGEK